MDEVIIEGLPNRWMIIRTMRMSGPDAGFVYVAHVFATRTKKRFLRKPEVRTGWYPAGFESRWVEDVQRWIEATDREIVEHTQRAVKS